MKKRKPKTRRKKKARRKTTVFDGVFISSHAIDIGESLDEIFRRT